MTSRLLAVVALAACNDGAMPAAIDALATEDAQPYDAAAPACLDEATYPMTLAHGAFPGGAHPDAIVYVPPGFDPTPPVDVVVYVHGFNNCIANVLGDTDTACTTGGAARSAFQLATQLRAAAKNALLVLPEVKYDQATGDPGALGTDGGMKALLDEALAQLPFAAPLGRVIVASHSGGYGAVSAMATIGGYPVDELWLFDSLYGFAARFDAYAKTRLAAGRFANVYSTSGGTLANSEAMADRAAGWVTADPSVLVDDRTTATWDAATYDHHLLFKHSGLSHDGVPRYYVEQMLRTSELADTGTCR